MAANPEKKAYSLALASLLLPAMLLLPYTLAAILTALATLIITYHSVSNQEHLKRGALFGALIVIGGSLIGLTVALSENKLPMILLIVYTGLTPSYTASFFLFHLIQDLQISILPLNILLCFLSVLVLNVTYFAFLFEALSHRILRYLAYTILLLCYMANIALYYCFYLHWY